MPPGIGYGKKVKVDPKSKLGKNIKKDRVKIKQTTQDRLDEAEGKKKGKMNFKVVKKAPTKKVFKVVKKIETPQEKSQRLRKKADELKTKAVEARKKAEEIKAKRNPLKPKEEEITPRQQMEKFREMLGLQFGYDF